MWILVVLSCGLRLQEQRRQGGAGECLPASRVWHGTAQRMAWSGTVWRGMSLPEEAAEQEGAEGGSG